MRNQPLTPSDIEKWLKTQNLKASALARLIDMPAWTVRRWELGKRPIPKWLRYYLELIAKERAKGRLCKRCGSPLPARAREDAKFCSGKCRTREYLERKADSTR